MEGGHALADVLLGAAEPGGRLPFVVPHDESDLPEFDKNATTVVYDRWHGQRLLDRDGNAAAYPLGFGLSYTSFAIADVDVSVNVEPAAIAVRATVANTGDRAGGHVVQVYAQRPGDGGLERFLVGFARVEVAAGAQAPVHIDVPLQRLATRLGVRRWELRAGSYRIDVGANAADPSATSATLEL